MTGDPAGDTAGVGRAPRPSQYAWQACIAWHFPTDTMQPPTPRCCGRPSNKGISFNEFQEQLVALFVLKISEVFRHRPTSRLGGPFKHSVVRLYIGVSPMITSMKSAHESVPFKHIVVRFLYRCSPLITSMNSKWQEVR